MNKTTEDIWFKGHRVRLTLREHTLKYKSGKKKRVSVSARILGFDTDTLIKKIQKKRNKVQRSNKTLETYTDKKY